MIKRQECQLLQLALVMLGNAGIFFDDSLKVQNLLCHLVAGIKTDHFVHRGGRGGNGQFILKHILRGSRKLPFQICQSDGLAGTTGGLGAEDMLDLQSLQNPVGQVLRIAHIHQVGFVAAHQDRPESHDPVQGVFHLQSDIAVGSAYFCVQSGSSAVNPLLHLPVCILLNAETVVGLAQNTILPEKHNAKDRLHILGRCFQLLSVGPQNSSDFLIHSVSFQI